MNMNRDDELKDLLEKAREGNASGEDYARLAEIVRADRSGAVIEQVDAFLEQEKVSSLEHVEPYDHAYWEQAFTEIKETFRHQPVIHHRRSWLHRWGWAAAAALLLLSAGSYLRTSTPSKTADAVKTGDIAPGKEGAILTLGDGTQVVLDSLGNGLIAAQNGTQVRLKDDVLVYDPANGANGNILYNTMTTPKGRQFRLTLPDGTLVWLNAASSIRYPTTFTGSERQVRITGEVYFEVAKNTKMPFRVNVNDKAEVEVLGTFFNVNAYENEANIATTLLSGAVKIRSSYTGAVILQPGQQAQMRANQRTVKIIDNADTGKVMAWRHGIFNFEDATVDEILRQLERWYDIDVVYKGAIPDIPMAGKITRDVPLSKLLGILKKLGLQYQMEGRQLIILP